MPNTLAPVSWPRMIRTHLRDLIEIGLIDSSWIERVPAVLRARLQDLFDHPEG